MSNYAEALAWQRNRQLTRDDVKWIVLPSGDLKLVDKPEWTARRTRELEAEAESQRTQWKHRQTHQPEEK